MHQSTRLLLLGQLSLFICLCICVALIPHFLFEPDEGGTSNYGTYVKTIIPYTIGFGICAICSIRAAYSLPKSLPSRKILSQMLVILGILYLLALLSTYPYKLNITFGNIHKYVSTSLVVYSLATGIWLVLTKTRHRVEILLLCTQAIGFLLGALTYFGTLHTLFIAESLESVAFGALLVSGMHTLTSQHQPSVT